jgi:hypothetical protein
MAPNCWTPTLAHSTSQPPRDDSTAPAAAAIDVGSPTSTRSDIVGTRCCSAIPAAVCRAPASSRSSTATPAPAPANACPIAAPRPDAPPVITAILPVRSVVTMGPPSFSAALAQFLEALATPTRSPSCRERRQVMQTLGCTHAIRT